MTRSMQGWEQREYRSGERVELHQPALLLDLDELCAGITLDSATLVP
jgi:hypothetical protein